MFESGHQYFCIGKYLDVCVGGGGGGGQWLGMGLLYKASISTLAASFLDPLSV